jgi:hypothetical protein
MMRFDKRSVKSNLTRANLAVGLGIGVITLLLVGFIILKNSGVRSVGHAAMSD